MSVFSVQNRRIVVLLAIVILIGTLLSACSPAVPDVDVDIAASTPLSETDPEVLQPTKTPTPSEPDEQAITTASGVQYIELEKGKGPFPQQYDVVILHYTGMMADGKIFDSTYDRGEPIMYTIGGKSTFDDWNEAIQLMQIGGEARLIIPPELLLDDKAEIPDGPFIYEVKLVAISTQDAYHDIKESDYQITDSGLKIFDLAVGEGAEVEAGKSISVHYTLWREGGEVVDSSLDRGRAFNFILGAHRVIPGLEEGVVGMKIGGSRQLVVPPELAYGEEGYGLTIDPTENIVYELMLVDILPPPPPPSGAPTTVAESEFTVTDSGLKYYDITVGEGFSLHRGQIAEFHYTGWLTDGMRFDSSLEHGNPMQIPIGVGSVIPGLDEGISTMQIGGTRQLLIPPELAYGDEGVDDIIPPNAALIFEIELLDAQ